MTLEKQAVKRIEGEDLARLTDIIMGEICEGKRLLIPEDEGSGYWVAFFSRLGRYGFWSDVLEEDMLSGTREVSAPDPKYQIVCQLCGVKCLVPERHQALHVKEETT